MGELRRAYRFPAPDLRDAGYRVACTDLRGHADSDTTFTSYGDLDTATDVIALIEAPVDRTGRGGRNGCPSQAPDHRRR
jgi:pimeloyl-ACP methyl ester carboxylesterase